MHNVAEVGDCSNPGRDVPQDEDRKHDAVVVEAATAHVENMDDDEGRQEDNNHNAVVVVAVGVSLV
jgi:hypothetical protein